MSFLNFYFSLGISFVGLAILGQPNRRLYPIVLLRTPLMKLPPNNSVCAPLQKNAL